MATPSMTPQNGNGDSKFLASLLKYWPILGGLVLVLGAYFSSSAQTSQNTKDVASLQSKVVTKEELQPQLQYLKDSLARIERNQEQIDQKVDQIQRRQRDR